MSTICLRHELTMLRLGVAGLRNGDRGFRTRDHARVLRDIDACDRCRAKKAPVPASRVDEVDRTAFKAVTEEPAEERRMAKAPRETARSSERPR